MVAQASLAAQAGTEVRRIFGLATVEMDVDTGELVRVCVDGWPDEVIYRTEPLIAVLKGFADDHGKSADGDAEVCSALETAGAFISTA